MFVRLWPSRHRAAMRCRAGLGQRPTALPTLTLRVVPFVSALVRPLRLLLRYSPCAPAHPIRWQGPRNADGRPPATLPGQDRPAATLKCPPFLLASPCFCCSVSSHTCLGQSHPGLTRAVTRRGPIVSVRFKQNRKRAAVECSAFVRHCCSSGLEVFRFESSLLGDTSQHSWPYLFAIVKGEDYV